MDASTISSGSTERLQEMVNSTTMKLNTIWDEVGFSAAERQVQIQVLLQEVQRLFEEKVADEEAVRDTFVASIADNKNKALEASTRLGDASPDMTKDEDGTLLDSLALTERLVHFEHLAGALEERVAAQTTKLEAFRATLAGLCGELDENLEAEWAAAGGAEGGACADLSEASLASFAERVAGVEAAKVARVAAVTELVAGCQELIAEMAVPPDTDLDAQIAGSLDGAGALVSTTRSASCVGIGAAALANLQARHGQLAAEREERSAYLMDMGEKVAKLWELLQISEEEQAAFEASLTGGLSEATIKVGEAELARLGALKSAKMAQLIGAKREAIEALWAATAATSAQKACFAGFVVSDAAKFDDALLEAHDAEVAALERRLETMAPLKELFEKYESGANARAELQEIQKDKDRLKGRNSSKQLKLEEGMSKQIKALPKVVEKLKKDVAAWEKAEGATFTVLEGPMSEDGEAAARAELARPCIEAVEDREARWEALKEAEKSAKEAAKNKGRESLSIHPPGGPSKGAKASLGGKTGKPSLGGPKKTGNPLAEISSN